MANKNAVIHSAGRLQEAAATDWLLTQALASDTISGAGTIPAGKQYICFGALTINNGIVVTVSTGGRLVVL